MKRLLTSRWGQLCTLVVFAVVAKLTGHLEALWMAPIFATVDRVAGHPDYTQDGTNKNIPWIFSRKTLVKFYDSSVVPQITNTDYSGEISAMGDKVIINTVPDVSVTAYKKGQSINWEDLESPAITMTMDRAQHFAFKQDKIDLKQFQDKAFMDKAAEDAAQKQKINIDEQFLANIDGQVGGSSLAHADNQGTTAGRKSNAYNLGTTGDNGIALTKTNIIDKILELSGVANEQNWPESDRWIVLPEVFAVLLKQSDIKDASMTGDGKSTLRTGKVGMLDKWTIYSSNLYTSISDTNTYYNIMFGHKSAIAFATQLLETEFFEKLETTFGKGMKGLQVYDWKVVKPEALGSLYAYKG